MTPEPSIDPQWLQMAAAQMHSEGRFQEWQKTQSQSEDIEDRRGEPKRQAAVQNDMDDEFANKLRVKGIRTLEHNEPPMKRIEPK